MHLKEIIHVLYAVIIKLYYELCYTLTSRLYYAEIHAVMHISMYNVCVSIYMTVFIPGGWPVCLWPAQWPDDRNI